METIVVIPARGGSKGIPGKNLRKLGGVSLLGRAVRTARQCRLVTRVVVSTDDAAIAAEARDHGAEVVERPAEISGDKASSEAALLHVLDALADAEGYQPDVTVLLQCTAPLIRAEDIDGTLQALIDEGADAAFAAVPWHQFVWRKGGAQGWEGANHDHGVRQMRQDRPEEVMEAGAVYAMRTAPFREAEHRFCGRLAVWTMPRARLLEIDDPEDLELAETLLHLGGDSAPSFRPEAVVFDFDGVLTDNRVWLDRNGSELVACSRGDGMGMNMLRDAGLPVLILSKETDGVVGARARKLGVDVIQGCDDKLPALRDWAQDNGVALDRAVYVGNDINDVDCMQAVGLAIAPGDAHPRAKRVAHYVAQASGGFGVAREVAELTLRALEKRQ